MCKKIKQIYDNVLNVLGCNKKHLSIELPDDFSPVTLNIVWSGKAVQFCYTQLVINSHGGHWVKPVRPYKYNYANGDASAETIDIFRGIKQGARYRVEDNIVYINCTNVTSLTVNGQVLI